MRTALTFALLRNKTQRKNLSGRGPAGVGQGQLSLLGLNLCRAMVVWAKRLYFDHSFDSCWAELITLSARGVANVMMIEAPEPSREEAIAIYIMLPDAQLLSQFPDFVQIDENLLPREAALLYGDVGVFRARFSPIPPK